MSVTKKEYDEEYIHALDYLLQHRHRDVSPYVAGDGVRVLRLPKRQTMHRSVRLVNAARSESRRFARSTPYRDKEQELGESRSGRWN